MAQVGIVANGARGALVAAVAGALAIVMIGLFFSVGQPFGTINDITLTVMTLALLPVMRAHYELGGAVPLRPAQLSLTVTAIAIVAWSIAQLALITGAATYDYEHAATGLFGIATALQIVIGLWIAGASAFAGSWLPRTVRTLGVIAGVGTAVMSIGLLMGGGNHPLTWLGGVGYQFVLPAWAFMLSRVFRAHVPAPTGTPIPAAA